MIKEKDDEEILEENEGEIEEEVKLVELIGVDKILHKLHGKLRKDLSFFLIGQAGIGKSEILKWAYHHYTNGEKLYISCNTAYGEILKSIARKQKITISKKKLIDLEKEIMKSSIPVALFIDDLEAVKPKQAIFFNAWERWNKIFFAGRKKNYNDNILKMLWNKEKIYIKGLTRENQIKLAEHIIEKLACIKSIDEIIDGVPARAWAKGKGEYVRNNDNLVEGEEINLAPALAIVVAVIMAMRYIAVGTGQRDLYILAGLGMAVAGVLRIAIRELSKK